MEVMNGAIFINKAWKDGTAFFSFGFILLLFYLYYIVNN